jgi:hypothetical protein
MSGVNSSALEVWTSVVLLFCGTIFIWYRKLHWTLLHVNKYKYWITNEARTKQVLERTDISRVFTHTNSIKIQGSSSSLTMGTCPVTLATNSVIIHEWGTSLQYLIIVYTFLYSSNHRIKQPNLIWFDFWCFSSIFSDRGLNCDFIKKLICWGNSYKNNFKSNIYRVIQLTVDQYEWLCYHYYNCLIRTSG